MADVSAHYDGSAPTYHQQYDSELIWENTEYPANYFRLQKVIQILQDHGVKNFYDLGAGEVSPAIEIHNALDIEFRASDLSPEMVRHGRENLVRNNIDPDWLALVDIRDFRSIKSEAERVGQFDAVIALGVIPHVADDAWFVEAMSLFLKPGGTLILQFRNSMFSMLTFNRLTKEFILDEVMEPIPQNFKDVVEMDLDQRLAIDKPPIRRRDDGNGYDEILSKFNNPFELAEVVKAQGYQDLYYRWYNFHPTYPMIAGSFDSKEYRQAQIDLEADTSWRGMFLCSAGMIIAKKSL
jgi:2-polyprenyl-3-methyl-5-hydroxy-6-metoxy-1,4-benzoquinol methylase